MSRDPFSKRIIFIHLEYIKLARAALLGLGGTNFSNVPLKLLSPDRCAEMFTICKGAILNHKLLTVLREVGLTLTQLVIFEADLATNRQAHQLIQDHSLHFDGLNWVGSAPVGASHVLIVCEVLSAEHVIAGFVRATDRITQQLEANSAGERVLRNALLTLLAHLVKLYGPLEVLSNNLGQMSIFLLFDALDEAIGPIERGLGFFLGVVFIELFDFLTA